MLCRDASNTHSAAQLPLEAADLDTIQPADTMLQLRLLWTHNHDWVVDRKKIYTVQRNLYIYKLIPEVLWVLDIHKFIKKIAEK